MMQVWIWAAYLLTALIFLAVMGSWLKRWRLLYLWLLPVWAFLVWPQAWRQGESELVPYWANLLAAYWAESEPPFAWSMVLVVGAALCAGVGVDWLRRKRSR